jgi:lipoprotein signal peptidase
MHRVFARWGGAAAVMIAVVALDQCAKVAATHVRSAEVIPARNPGMITGWSPVSVSVLIVMSVAVLLGFVGIVGRWAVQLDISPMIPALVIGGLVAHTIDRVRFGAVRDFLATGWLIIDVGDLAVVTGLVALVVAFGWRVKDLRKSSQRIELELPTLRAVVVDYRSTTAA